MRVLVCGGRDFINYPAVKRVLDGLKRDRGITTIISGHARGADQLGERWARETSTGCMDFPADWDKFGKRAGPIRNQQMLTEGKPDLVVAFPGGPGTAHMVAISRRAKIEVLIVDSETV